MFIHPPLNVDPSKKIFKFYKIDKLNINKIIELFFFPADNLKWS